MVLALAQSMMVLALARSMMVLALAQSMMVLALAQSMIVLALAQIAALTETEMDEMSVEMGSVLLSQMSGKSPGEGNNPLAKLSPEQVIQDVEAFLREQR